MNHMITLRIKLKMFKHENIFCNIFFKHFIQLDIIDHNRTQISFLKLNVFNIFSKVEISLVILQKQLLEKPSRIHIFKRTENVEKWNILIWKRKQKTGRCFKLVKNDLDFECKRWSVSLYIFYVYLYLYIYFFNVSVIRKRQNYFRN